jgi:hypothetical protein
MPMGYPATQSGVEINLLKLIFTPREAQISTHLDYRHKRIGSIRSWRASRLERQCGRVKWYVGLSGGNLTNRASCDTIDVVQQPMANHQKEGKDV